MQLSPYLTFNSDCEAAFKLYEQCLGGKVETMMRHEGTPAAEHVPAEWRKKILHARFTVAGQVLMGTDAPPAMQGRYEPPKGCPISLQTKDPDEAERIFHALAGNGQTRIAIQETFWAARFGMCVDRLGIPWMVNYEKAA